MKSSKANGSRVHKYPIDRNHSLYIEERRFSSAWWVIDRRSKEVVLKSEKELPKGWVILNQGEWSCYREGKLCIISYKLDFPTATEGILLLLHEAGHLATWGRAVKFSKESINFEERLAWAFALRYLRKINKKIGVKLTNKKNRSDLKSKIHKWIEQHKEKR